MSTPMSGGYYPPTSPQINFDWLSQAWSLFRAQMGAWIGAVLLFLLITLVIGVPLAFVTGYAQQFSEIINAARNGESGPQPSPFAHFGSDLLFGMLTAIVPYVLIGGLYRMAIRQGRGEVVKATDVFSAFDVALPLIALGFITQILTVIGTYLCFVPGFIVGGLFMFAPLLVVDRRLGPIQAITESIALLKSQWLMATLFFFVVSLIGIIGYLVCLVGLAFTLPILPLSIALAYLTFTQQSQPMPPPPFYGTPPPQQGVWPPPPGV